ncbi:hypothetical protein ACIBCA_16335 [Kitasatospora sp. NPDC051170]|uniref:hypothetical protein n=1 Tax=Kitasatospora sp. NPDC051170 TaxID=3364056 RepID=UPI00378F8913
MTTAQRRRLTTAFVATGITLGAAACSSADDFAPGGRALSYDRVRTVALDTIKNGTDTCPLGLDFAKAASTAGITGAVAPDTHGGHAVSGDAGDGVAPQPWPSGVTHPPSLPEQPAVPPSAEITCAYTVGSSTVEVQLLAVSKNDVAFNLMLPRLRQAGQLSVDDLTTAYNGRPGIGETRLTPGPGSAAVARIALNGAGDLVMLVSQGSSDADRNPALAGEPLRKATETLARQIG